MKNPALALIALVVLALGIAACSGDDDAPPIPTAEVERLLEEAMAENGIPGAAIAIDTGGDPWIHTAGEARLGEGDDGNTGWETDTRSAYRSITKSFVVTVILRLAQSGQLDLVNTIDQYVDGVPGGDEITVGQLAAMRSGLANYSALPSFQEEMFADFEREWTTDELLSFALAEPLNFPPGERYEYSNTNTLLLGEVIESVTGNPWPDEVASTFELPTVVYPDNDPPPEPLAVGYGNNDDGEPEPMPAVKASGFGAAGGLFGDINDLLAWGDLLFDPAILTPKMQSERIALPSDTADDPNSPEYDAYGLGLGEIDGWWGHTGAGLGYQGLVMHSPGGYRVAILMNATNENQDVPADLFRKVAALLAG